MSTQIRKPVMNTARVTVVGLLSLVAMTTWADTATAQSATAPVLMGHIEVTARPIYLVADGVSRITRKVDSLPLIGRMTVTARRLPTFAEQTSQPASAGEPAVRNRTPRAVLVQ